MISEMVERGQLSVKTRLIIVCCAIALVLLYIFNRFYTHEKSQSASIQAISAQNELYEQRITELEQGIAELEQGITELEQGIIELEHGMASSESKIDDVYSAFEDLRIDVAAYSHLVNGDDDVKYKDDAFNYLAIGNSITLHRVNEYWWNEVGMAATEQKNDYVHIVADHLEREHEKCEFYALNYSGWEANSHDRAQSYYAIDPYMSNKLDLITVQLGENVFDLTTFEFDFDALLRYLSRKSPNAKIMVVGDFKGSDEREDMKRRVVEKWGGGVYLSLSEIRDNAEYQCGLGTVVYDADGGAHTVEHDGVAWHPGDKGMRYIADAIIKHLDD